MNASTAPDLSDKPRFRVRHRHGRLYFFMRLVLEVEDVQSLQKRLSEGVVAALVHNVLELSDRKKP